jgi:2-amino-4-hydroxy-6-hydroxymethyldihydropteridine diphosphokinase
VRGMSPVLESAPVGFADQNCLLNAFAAIETALPPGRLRFGVLRPTETALGRLRSSNKFGPRTVDLEVILYGPRVLVCGGWRIPDPDLLCEAHVACPMARLAPQLEHSKTGETMEAIAKRVGCDGIRLRLDIVLDTPPRMMEGTDDASAD